ncbi:hypothetical protein [Paenibacillus alvei]|uniref:Uncharacterized protein n=1 Tax=Paenibacillus alvei TaxID=44250 RepID=A0AAP6ZW65_PAEAL|nr:hypothetical protein [Paenibacillus alvei]NOJ70055.1 hypothetical protein [Paenibacillus alvei]
MAQRHQSFQIRGGSIINPIVLDVSVDGDHSLIGVLLLLYGMLLSLTSLIFGTITGVMVEQNREQIKLFR